MTEKKTETLEILTPEQVKKLTKESLMERLNIATDAAFKQAAENAALRQTIADYAEIISKQSEALSRTAHVQDVYRADMAEKDARILRQSVEIKSLSEMRDTLQLESYRQVEEIGQKESALKAIRHILELCL